LEFRGGAKRNPIPQTKRNPQGDDGRFLQK
jgi:hypothetical protein